MFPLISHGTPLIRVLWDERVQFKKTLQGIARQHSNIFWGHITSNNNETLIVWNNWPFKPWIKKKWKVKSLYIFLIRAGHWHMVWKTLSSSSQTHNSWGMSHLSVCPPKGVWVVIIVMNHCRELVLFLFNWI